jgi:hypothetical protein
MFCAVSIAHKFESQSAIGLDTFHVVRPRMKRIVSKAIEAPTMTLEPADEGGVTA